MAPEREKKPKKATKARRRPEGEVPPGEFEEIELPTEAPLPEEEGEFEEIDVEAVPGEEKHSAEALLAAKGQLEQRLLLDVTEQALSAESGTDRYGFENIVGVGVSEKLVDEDFTGEQCVTVYVVAKVPKDEIANEALVPDEINGVLTDVVATGELTAFPHRGRYRPAPGGVSVGHFRITAGTIGCLVRRVLAILGIGMFALPTGILGAGFIEEMQRKAKRKVCPHCGQEIS
jgi:hypothetical protein